MVSPKADPLAGRFTVLPSGCWRWNGAACSSGYGSLTWRAKGWLAHRLAYTLVIGPIPAGYEVHHTCGNRLCINPAHLQPLPGRAHRLVTDTPMARNAAKTHCRHGHPFTPENTYIHRNGRRECRACLNARRARLRERMKDEG